MQHSTFSRSRIRRGDMALVGALPQHRPVPNRFLYVARFDRMPKTGAALQASQ
jgi:hypothetical protein